jgi:hypothetical protein
MHRTLFLGPWGNQIHFNTRAIAKLTYQLAPQLIYTECSRSTQTDMDTYIDTDVTVAFVVHGTE